MSSCQQKIIECQCQLVDMMLVAVACWFSHFLTPVVQGFLAETSFGQKHGIWLFPSDVPGRPLPVESYFWVMVVVVPFTIVLLGWEGFYRDVLSKSMSRSLGQLLLTAFWIALILGAAIIFLKAQPPPRAFVVLLFVFGGALLLVHEWMVKRRLCNSREDAPRTA